MANSKMKPSVYLETTIVSYLTSRPVKNVVVAGKFEVTRQWWEKRRDQFDLFVSDAVQLEAAAGDPDAAQRRLEFIADIPNLKRTDEADELADELRNGIPLPQRAAADALHLAIAAVNGVDYLLTWNCRHLANVEHRHRIESICYQAGYRPPMICTPHELLEPTDESVS